ncbi:MAG: flagellar basal-body MS-ring/collar protein FliF [Alphaproteobacteria bacterium]|nr:flagellar basal-body MS-ring/collar protein FliF [Alphaproteobacteria bacterium]
MTGVAAGFVAFFIYIATRLTTPGMTLLFADLDTADSGQIVAKLENMGVPYELRGNGNQILVPSDQVLRLRLSVAQEGLPSGGSMGYELFDRSESLGTSNFVLNIHRLRALEGEIARTIGSLSTVRAARVHLVLPKRELFSRDKQEPSASILLQMNGGYRLTKSEVFAIQHLVASAVPKLRPSRISILDGQGTLLAAGRDDDLTAIGSSVGGEDMTAAYEARLGRKIEEMLERTVGAGRVRAEVKADMDFDRITTTSETFDPDGQVVRSTQSVEENATTGDSDLSSPVTVASNLPANAPGAQPKAGTKSSTESTRIEETVNFEISKTTKTHVREAGIVNRLSVAVLIDGTYSDGGEGERIYKPRSAEELTQLTTLVRSAIGFDAKRGDTVELINMRFAKGEEVIDEPARPLFGLGKNDYIKLAELVILGVVSILVILLVVRPMVRRILDALPEAIASGKNLINESVAAAAASGKTALPPGQEPVMNAPGIEPPNPETEIESMIDLKQVEGRVRASSLKKIGEIVEKHPDEAVNIIRNWMYQES